MGATAAYSRVSTEEQGERNTIEVQLAVLRRLVPDAREYSDNGISGKVLLAEQPADVQLLADARAGKISEVVIYKLDRIGLSLRGMLAAYDALSAVHPAVGRS